MINIAFCESDEFVFLAAAQKSLYLQLIIHADDDGYVRGARGIMRLDGDAQEDLDALTAAGFLLKFPSGVVLIRHWRWHNQVRKDLYKPTVCAAEAAMVAVDENDVYYLIKPGEERKPETRNAKRGQQAQEGEQRTNPGAKLRVVSGGSFDTDEFFEAALRRSRSG